MFGSEILDVAIGLALIFLMLSLVATAVREVVEAIVKSRAVQLERGIRSLLNDPDGQGLSKHIYEHPLICSLYPDSYDSMLKRFRGANLPTYIPSRNFAAALIDLTVRGVTPGPYAAQQTSPDFTIAGMRASVQRIPSEFVQRAVLSAIDNAHGNVRRVQHNLEAWYDSAMDRVSGHYKRRTQLWLFIIGLATAAGLNVNTLTIADYLARDDAARAALVDRARGILADSSYRNMVNDTALTQAAGRVVYENLQSLNLPIGWDRKLPAPPDAGPAYYLRQLAGILVTALAIMLGAPFWFDLLNKFMVIRSTVKPHEKSPEEGSEDRQPKGKSHPTTVVSVQPETVVSGTTVRGAASEPQLVHAMAEPEPPHEEHEWADGNAKEGIL